MMSVMSNQIDELYLYEDIWGNQIPYYYLVEDVNEDDSDDEDEHYYSVHNERIEEMISKWELLVK
jgi:hypothetical protein